MGMLRRLCRTRKDMRVGKGLTVDGMLVHKHRYTEDMLDEEQKHQCGDQTLQYIVNFTHLL